MTLAVMFLPRNQHRSALRLLRFLFLLLLTKTRAFTALLPAPKSPNASITAEGTFHLVHGCVSALRKVPQMLLVTEPGSRLCGCYGAISLALLLEMLYKLVRGMFPYYIFMANTTKQAKWEVVRNARSRGPPRSYHLRVSGDGPGSREFFSALGYFYPPFIGGGNETEQNFSKSHSLQTVQGLGGLFMWRSKGMASSLTDVDCKADRLSLPLRALGSVVSHNNVGAHRALSDTVTWGVFLLFSLSLFSVYFGQKLGNCGCCRPGLQGKHGLRNLDRGHRE